MTGSLYPEYSETGSYFSPCKGMLVLDMKKGEVLKTFGDADFLARVPLSGYEGRDGYLKNLPREQQTLKDLVTEAAVSGIAWVPCYRFEATHGGPIHYSLTILHPRVSSKGCALVLLGPPKTPEEAQLQLTEEKFALMGRLVPQLTHQILNPLQIIMGRLQLLMEDAGFDDNISDVLSRIWKQTQSILMSLEKFHELFQPGIKATELLDMGDIFDEVASLYHYFAVQNQVELIRAVSTSAPPVRGKRNEMVLCFLSILLHLAEVALPGTSITVSFLPGQGADEEKYLAIKFITLYNYGDVENSSGIFAGGSITLGRFVSAFCLDIINKHEGRVEISSHKGGALQLTVNLLIENSNENRFERG